MEFEIFCTSPQKSQVTLQLIGSGLYSDAYMTKLDEKELTDEQIAEVEKVMTGYVSLLFATLTTLCFIIVVIIVVQTLLQRVRFAQLTKSTDHYLITMLTALFCAPCSYGQMGATEIV